MYTTMCARIFILLKEEQRSTSVTLLIDCQVFYSFKKMIYCLLWNIISHVFLIELISDFN